MFTKHFSRRTPIKVAIESDDPTQTAVVEDPTDQPAAAAAAAAAPTESNEADLTPLEMGPEEDVSESEVIIDDMEEESKDLNTAADAVDGLDAIADKLEGQVADGGATPETMEIVEVAVEHFVYALTKKRNLHRVIHRWKVSVALSVVLTPLRLLSKVFVKSQPQVPKQLLTSLSASLNISVVCGRQSPPARKVTRKSLLRSRNV